MQTPDERTDRQDLRMDRQDAQISVQRLNQHDVRLAVHDEQISELVKVTTALTAGMNRVMWALIGASLTIAGSCAVVVLTGGGIS